MGTFVHPVTVSVDATAATHDTTGNETKLETRYLGFNCPECDTFELWPHDATVYDGDTKECPACGCVGMVSGDGETEAYVNVHTPSPHDDPDAAAREYWSKQDA